MTAVYMFGYGGPVGGANTEFSHTVRLFRRYGLDVNLVPTWGRDDAEEDRMEAIGATTHHITPDEVETLPDIEEAITIGFCNPRFLEIAPRLRKLGCKIVWANCMTISWPHEKVFFEASGPPDALMCQSRYQRDKLADLFKPYNVPADRWHVIRGAFDLDSWKFAPRTHYHDGDFVIGKLARGDAHKWHRRHWSICDRVQCRGRTAIAMGVNDEVKRVLGQTPPWAMTMEPNEIPATDFYRRCHCLMLVNGGARENWPRVGLEAMAAGVPIIAEKRWGWLEMVEHGVTGFLGDNDADLSSYATILANDEKLRLKMASAARWRLENELANPETIWTGWRDLFGSLWKDGE